MLKRILPLLALMCIFAAPAAADENDGDCVYRLFSVDGEYLTMRAGRMHEDDEYISGDNRHFRVIRVDDTACRAYAEYVGMADAGETMSGPDGFTAVMADIGAAHAEAASSG